MIVYWMYGYVLKELCVYIFRIQFWEYDKCFSDKCTKMYFVPILLYTRNISNLDAWIFVAVTVAGIINFIQHWMTWIVTLP
jgi:hypothetical protein